MINKFYWVSSFISGNKTEKHSSLECNVFEHKTKQEVGRFIQHYFYTDKKLFLNIIHEYQFLSSLSEK